LEVLDRIHNAYGGIVNRDIHLQIYGPVAGTNTFVDLHLQPHQIRHQILQTQTLWSLIRRTNLRGQFSVNLLQPQITPWTKMDSSRSS